MSKLMLAILVDDKSEHRFDSAGKYNCSNIINSLRLISDLKVIAMWAVNPGRESIDLTSNEAWPVVIQDTEDE